MAVGPDSDMTATLIVSVSDISEPTLSHCAELAAALDTRLVPASWLLSPRPRGGRHLPDAPVIRFLRDRVSPSGAARDALVLHGFDHTLTPLARTRIGRRAEFAGLPSHEASLRLIAATRAMDDLGLRAAVFAPPRWLASTGTVVALRRLGFRVCADSAGVRLLDRPGEHGLLLRARVLSAHRPAGTLSSNGMLGSTPDTAEAWRRRSLVASAARGARRGGLVRIAAEAPELARAGARRAVLDAVDAALAADAMPLTYDTPLPTLAQIPA
jgi:predicted deacetylase